MCIRDSFNTMTELKKHTITIQQLEKEIKQINENYLKLKLQDIYTIYSCYDEKIKNNYLDADDLLKMCIRDSHYIGCYGRR